MKWFFKKSLLFSLLLQRSYFVESCGYIKQSFVKKKETRSFYVLYENALLCDVCG